MEIRHLRSVVAIARHGSFTKAGEELHLAQSAVSQQVRRLEAELGITLFTRTSRNVELTAEGAVVLEYAQRVLSEVDGLRDELDERAGLLSGDLRLGGMWPTGLYDLYAVIADFHAQHPGVAIHFVEGTQEELLAQIRNDELDSIFTAVDPDALGEDFAATLLSEEEFVCTLPVGHPLAEQDHVTFQQLAGLDLVTYRENSALRRRLEATLDERGLTPRNAFICTEMGAVRALVSKGMGVAVIPRSAAEEPGPPIELRPIGPEPFTWPVALVWRAGRRQPPAAKAFLSLRLSRAPSRLRPQSASSPRRLPPPLRGKDQEMRIAIAGATGLVGRHLAGKARAAGHDVVELSRAKGVDLLTSDAIDAALAGVEVVIDVTNSPTTDEEGATDFFVTVAERLGDAAAHAGAARTVVLSIIGVDRTPNDGYYAAKLAHENATRQHAPDPRVLRASPFHDFAGQSLEWGRDGDESAIEDMTIQPVALSVVAEVLLDMATDEDDRPMVELAGPKQERLVEMVKRLVEHRGDDVQITAVAVSDEIRDGALLPGPEAKVAGPDFEQWLTQRSAVRS